MPSNSLPRRFHHKSKCGARRPVRRYACGSAITALESPRLIISASLAFSNAFTAPRFIPEPVSDWPLSPKPFPAWAAATASNRLRTRVAAFGLSCLKRRRLAELKSILGRQKATGDSLELLYLLVLPRRGAAQFAP